MAAGGFKEFVAGETLDEDDINDFLMQGVLVFAGTAARGSAITAPVEGQFSFLKDSDTVEFYDSTQWVPLATGEAYATISGGASTATSTEGGETYNLHTFTANDDLIVTSAGLIEFLVFSGGGAGGRSADAIGNAGGGAASGHYRAIESVAVGTAAVVIGAGGPGVSGSNGAGGDGSPSSIATVLTALTGGGGGANFAGKGRTGSSGGGNSTGNFNSAQTEGGIGAQPLGFNGGIGEAAQANTAHGAGGGAGAGAVGQNGGSSVGGNGGAGLDVSDFLGQSPGTTIIGGGGGGRGATNGTGGTGGGTNAADPSTAAAANSASGSGGSRSTSGNGGSGIVYVRVKA